MAKQTYYESIMEALQQAVDFKNGDMSKGRIKVVKTVSVSPINEYSREKTREIRQQVNLPQKHFAALLGVSIKSVEAWESGKRQPTGSAKRLFQLIENDPSIVNTIIR